MLLSQALSPVAARNGSNFAFRYLKHTVTYRDFWETANRFSYFLQKELGHSLRVGLWMSNSPLVAQCFAALANTRSCTVPLNPTAPPDQNLFKIKNAGITALLCTGDYARGLKDFLQQNGLGSIKVIDMDGKRCAEYDPAFAPSAGRNPNEKDAILLFYTPGTTGKMKGCLFSHGAVVQAMSSTKTAYKILPSDVFFTQGHLSDPFHFIHYLMAPLSAGAGVYVSDQTDFKELLPALTEFRVTRFSPNAAQLAELLKFSEAEKLPIVTVKHLSFRTGTRLTAEAWECLGKQGKIGVIAAYGMTEYLGPLAMGTPEALAKPDHPGFIGPVPLGVKWRVLDDNNDEINKKKPQQGQLAVMGAGLMDKYLDLPEEQKITVRGTWLFTGDLVDVSPEGNVAFHERKADVVATGDGRRILARDVEPFALEIPQVEEAAYIGVRDRNRKIVPAIVIVRKYQAQLSEKEVRDHLAKKVAVQKVPDIVLFTDAMPRTLTGAINRARLRAQFEGS